ncbi:antitermination protein [Proteus mirabilis]|uniref:antitermination protein n=1 Tax=Proteus mirabilis TaxID=584 RepID=UPI001B36C7F4|nr:antitermination protein [Proteus mirabilis]EKV1609698.1 antitermination protein [Proteus mirabilis]MBQ0616563.1 antitermination protein [Proteus mirabilis]MCJ2218536.1 antitermination protein [Proteus mirabilis]HCU2505191.1 antitermination protein [Proteus mirabilis]
MKLESALKQFYPKSPMITDTPNCTDPDRMKGMDTAGALGMTEQRAKFGMSAFFAKNDVSEEDKFSTVEQLTQYALKVTPKLVAKSAGNKLGYCLVILAKMAFEDYARSAGSVCECPSCKGRKLIYSHKDVIKYPGIIKANGEVITDPVIKNELVGDKCQTCRGKGVITHRCRCNGRGQVLDEEQTELQGVPVFKKCPRCAGRGYKRMPSSIAFTAIKYLIPDLTQSSWSRNWKPLYDKLSIKCHVEEYEAERIFNKTMQ